MRTALDLDGRHAAYEGLRVFARLWVGLRHGQQLARECQPLGLGRRREQPVVANALEARRQHVQQQPADELLAVYRDGALAARVVGTGRRCGAAASGIWNTSPSSPSTLAYRKRNAQLYWLTLERAR